MPRPNRFQKDTPTPLRQPSHAPDFTSSQMLVLGCFVSALVAVGHGVYCNSVAGGKGIRLRIYADGESYEDTIYPADDFAYILGDYARQFKCQTEYMQILGAANSRPAERQSEGREQPPEGEDTGAGSPKPLRASKGG